MLDVGCEDNHHGDKLNGNVDDNNDNIYAGQKARRVRDMDNVQLLSGFLLLFIFRTMKIQDPTHETMKDHNMVALLGLSYLDDAVI